MYYLLCRFGIRGGRELYNLGRHEFSFGTNEAGRFLRFDERLSKNCHVNLQRFQEEHFRPTVMEHDVDMILTIQLLIDHLPVSGTFLFYQCIDNPETHAWFLTNHVSEKKLTSCPHEIHEECVLVTKAVSNKFGQTTCITHMCSEGVPLPLVCGSLAIKVKGRTIAPSKHKCELLRDLQAKVLLIW